jgi:NDP-sugar pyrophosphorylase family protein
VTASVTQWPVAILAGGLATRLGPVTEQIPKALVSVAGQPFLAHQLRLLCKSGFRKVVMCVGHRGHMIQEQFGDGTNLDLALQYSADGPELLGTGGAIRKALPMLGDTFLVLYGDSYLPIDYTLPAVAFASSGNLGLMTVFRNEGRWDSSNIEYDNATIRLYDKEKPTPKMKHIDYGLGFFRAEAFADWTAGERFELSDVYRELIAREQLAGYEVASRFYEIGSPAGLAELDSFLRNQELSVPK